MQFYQLVKLVGDPLVHQKIILKNSIIFTFQLGMLQRTSIQSGIQLKNVLRELPCNRDQVFIVLSSKSIINKAKNIFSGILQLQQGLPNWAPVQADEAGQVNFKVKVNITHIIVEIANTYHLHALQCQYLRCQQVCSLMTSQLCIRNSLS